MFLKESSLLFLVLTVILSAVTSSPIYTAVSSKVIRPNSNYNVTITVEKGSTAPIDFILQIQTVIDNNDHEVYEIEEEGEETTNKPKEPPKPEILVTSEKITIQPGIQEIVSLQIGELKETKYNLTIVGEIQGVENKTEDSSIIYKDTKQQSLFLQTDKPIYKPGETVNFRVVLLNRFLRPISSKLVNVTIKDSQQNIIKIWNNESFTNGLFSSKLELSDEPILGDWTISATCDGTAESSSFAIDQYVLPKFKVDVNLEPNFITFNNSKFTAVVKAMYTYGKPMTGTVEVRFQEYQPYRWHGSSPLKVISRKSPIIGTTTFEFDPVTELDAEKLSYERQYTVEATVVDELTGREQNASSTITIHQFPYKVELIEQDRSYKPGFPITITFKVTDQNGNPISDPDPKALKVEHGFSYHVEDSVKYFSIPPTGIVKVTLTTPSNELNSPGSLEVTYKEFSQTFYPPGKVTSKSKTYMKIELGTKNPEVSTELKATIQLNKEFDSYTWILYGRGEVLDSKRADLELPVKEAEFNFLVPRSAAPEATLLVYTIVKSTDEVVVDSIKFNLNSVFDNFLNFTLSKEAAEPGQNLSISMDTTAGSTIAIRGVDQSVLLLKEDKDITVKKVEDELKTYQNQVNNFRLWGGSPSFQIFEECGLVILTNALMEKEHFRPLPRPMPFFRAGVRRNKVAMMAQAENAFDAMPMALAAENRGGIEADFDSSQIRVRKNFPETWLWKEISVNSSSSTFETIVPDTLTSWYISGYSLSQETGIGVTKSPSIFKSFRPFFITLNKPYSVVKGEVFGLQVLVHNYIDKEITAKVTLQNKDNAFEFLETSESKEELTKEVKLAPESVKSVTFVIKPTKFGNINLDLRAVCPIAGDAISQIQIVKPPGQKQSRNNAILVDLRQVSSFEQELSTAFPPQRVEGADNVKISVISDLLGSTISNLDKLLQMPCGCGEQNMLNFVPDIVILDYLTASGTLTPEIQKKALHFLEMGYQRELTYRHSDGSFSAFGTSDLHGSTWLTAFVVRSFISAKPYITIDDRIITDGLEFLASKQQSDGSFVEHGTVLHADMKGGATDSYSLSSYVLLAFIESANITSIETTRVKSSEIIQKGISYITSASKDLQHPYPLTLITYTLQAAGNAAKTEYQSSLEQLAKRDGDLIYWEPPKKVKNETEKKLSHYHWEPSTKPVSVEMTAYNLLIYLKENNLEKALSVGRWLIQQRNAEGGFISTQDTVVGLTALGKFALATKSNENNMEIKASHGTPEVISNFVVNKDNAMVLQEIILPGTTEKVKFSAIGNGSALAQLTWSYYVEDKSEKPAFYLDVKVNPEGKNLKLEVCTKYTPENPKDTESNMAVVEVNLPSGYAFDSDSLPTINQIDGVKRFDLSDGDTKLNVYYNTIGSSEPKCLNIVGNQIFKVGNPSPAYATVYDYYDTTRRARVFYNPPNVEPCEVCGSEQECMIQNCV